MYTNTDDALPVLNYLKIDALKYCRDLHILPIMGSQSSVNMSWDFRRWEPRVIGHVWLSAIQFNDPIFKIIVCKVSKPLSVQDNRIDHNYCEEYPGIWNKCPELDLNIKVAITAGMIIKMSCNLVCNFILYHMLI